MTSASRASSLAKFVHLHNHSHFSLLDGLSRPEGLVKRAAELEQPAVAITDHGSLSGAYKLWKASQGTGVKPIIGCEFYIAPEGREKKEPVRWGEDDQRDEDLSGQGAYGHITILAQDATGLRNLFRLQEAAYREGFYRKPRIDLELLSQHQAGLICLSGCAGGLLCTNVRLGRLKNARSHAGELKDIFGDRAYIEVMYHGIDFEPAMNAELLRIADVEKMPMVATNDSHYLAPGDRSTHAALLCVQTRSRLAEPKFQFNGDGYFLQSGSGMDGILREAGLEAGAAATLEIAESVGSYDEVFGHRLRMPRFDFDATRYNSSEAALKDIALGRNVTADFNDTYDQRMRYELDTITALGFADYFLVVADILNDARDEGILLGPARGSAGGSLVAFALGITSVDPIPSGLLFERFLNPERVGLPDIDIDVQEDRRDDLLGMARRKYGEDHVAQLGTFGTIGAKAALKDSARVLGHPYRTGEERTWELPKPKFGRAPTLAEYTGKKDDLYDLAVGLEGTIRSESVHAAAVVISPEPLSDAMPLRLQGGKGHNVAALDMHEVEALGFVKTDFLGLRTLKVIDDCLSVLKVSERGVSGDGCLPTSPANCTDPATYELLSRGDSVGVFQLDGSGMRGLLRQVVPDTFSDISAVLALYRPGPMGAKADRDYAQRKHSKQRVSYPHPELAEALAPILSETHGLIVYQEQVLEVLAAVGGYTYGSAELIFNAMRKKDHDKMAEARPDFFQRLWDRDYSPEAIDALWDTLIPFADYSFNKSHSTGYGLIAYWTAYLKANHPTEWMASLLSNEPDPEKLGEYLAECRRMGIPLLPPDVNASGPTFTPTGEGIRYGLSAIKGAGEKAVAGIRGAQPFKTLSDFYRRVPAAALNTGVLGALVRSGALDSLCASREGHAAAYDTLAERASAARKARRGGQRGVVKPSYRVSDVAPDIPLRRQWELETLGVELSTGTVYLKPTTPLDVSEMNWLKKTLDSYPGHQPVRLDLEFSTVDLGCTIQLDVAREELATLGKLEVSER